MKFDVYVLVDVVSKQWLMVSATKEVLLGITRVRRNCKVYHASLESFNEVTE